MQSAAARATPAQWQNACAPFIYPRLPRGAWYVGQMCATRVTLRKLFLMRTLCNEDICLWIPGAFFFLTLKWDQSITKVASLYSKKTNSSCSKLSGNFNHFECLRYILKCRSKQRNGLYNLSRFQAAYANEENQAEMIRELLWPLFIINHSFSAAALYVGKPPSSAYSMFPFTCSYWHETSRSSRSLPKTMRRAHAARWNCTQTAPKRSSQLSLHKKSSLRLHSKTGQRWKAEQKLDECEQKRRANNLFPSNSLCEDSFAWKLFTNSARWIFFNWIFSSAWLCPFRADSSTRQANALNAK